jgi:hypothetical protein
MSVQQQQSSEKEPEKLKKIESRLESLIEVLGGPAVKLEEKSGGSSEKSGSKQGSQQKSTQQGSQQKSGTGQQGTQQGSQKGTQQGSQQQSTQQGTQKSSQQQGTRKSSKSSQGKNKTAGKQQAQKQSPKHQETSKWAEIGTIISNLHYQWNEFMPEIAKKGSDMKLVDNFDSALNKLTTTAATMDTEKTLTAANALYAYIPDIYSLYRTKMSPEVKRMIYYTRSIILASGKGEWDQVKKNSDSLGKSWSLFRNTLEKEQQKIGDKLNFSIYELDKVVADKNKQLTDIKGRITLSNIKELEKSYEDKEKQKQS